MSVVKTKVGRRSHESTVRTALAAGALVALLTPAAAAAATTGTGSTQAVTFTPSAQLSIAAAASVPVSLSSVTVVDTEADSIDWSASVAASNCFLPTSGLPATLNTTNATLPATNLTFAAGSGASNPTVSLTTGAPAPATLGGTNAFSAPATTGSLASPTFGTAVGVAHTTAYPASTDPLANNGTYTLTPSLNLNLSSTSTFVAVPQLYTCTLQYTITG